MEIKRYEGNGRMSKAVVHGDTLYLCGQTAREGGDVKDQTRIVLEKIEAATSKTRPALCWKKLKPCWVHMVPTNAIC